MMNRLHFVVPGDLNQLTGGYLYNRHMIDGLRERGWQVVVHQLAGTFPHVNRVAYDSAAQTLAQIPDGALVVIDGLALPAFVSMLAEQSSRLQLIALNHLPLAAETGLSVQEKERLAHIESKALAYMRRIIVTGPDTARILVAYGMDNGRIGMVQPGVARSDYEKEKRDGPLQLLCVATVTPRKGHHTLIEALAMLKELDWQLVCIGSLERSPDTVHALHRDIRAYGLSERVRLIGERGASDVAMAYRAADVFVLASYYESYGMVLSEAMVYGLPIVTTTGGSIRSTVPREAGLLVPPHDVAALAEALRSVIVDENVRRRLADHSRKIGRRLPAWSVRVMQFEAELVRSRNEPP